MYLEFKRNPEIPTEPETRLCVLSVLVTPTPTATPLAMPPLSLSHSFHPACSFCCACPLRSQPSCAALLNFTQILKMKSKFSYYNDYFETIPTAHSPPLLLIVLVLFRLLSFSFPFLLLSSFIQLLLLSQQLCLESIRCPLKGGGVRSFRGYPHSKVDNKLLQFNLFPKS